MIEGSKPINGLIPENHEQQKWRLHWGPKFPKRVKPILPLFTCALLLLIHLVNTCLLLYF